MPQRKNMGAKGKPGPNIMYRGWTTTLMGLNSNVNHV